VTIADPPCTRRYAAAVAYRPGRSDLPLDESSEGVDRKRVTRLLVAALAVVVAIVFMVQNDDEVELNFLMFSATTRLWVGLLLALLLGAALGQAAEVLWARRKRRRAERSD
jgi:uncharacterized integral membrane protein